MVYITSTRMCIKAYLFMVQCSRAPMASVNWGAKGGDDVNTPVLIAGRPLNGYMTLDKSFHLSLNFYFWKRFPGIWRSNEIMQVECFFQDCSIPVKETPLFGNSSQHVNKTAKWPWPPFYILKGQRDALNHHVSYLLNILQCQQVIAILKIQWAEIFPIPTKWKEKNGYKSHLRHLLCSSC